MRLQLGKLPLEILEKHVLSNIESKDRDVVLGPGVGLDFAVVRTRGGYLIVSSDPVTGADRELGWWSVNVSANDVATSGARPRFLNAVILLPEESEELVVERVMSGLNKAATELEISVLGGHTESTPRLNRPIVISTVFGFADRYVTSGDAEEEDVILMSKTAGIEGTSIITNKCREDLKGLKREVLASASSLYRQMSVVRDASVAFSTGFVHAMHDPTEGGVLGGVYEMAAASKSGFTLFEKDVPLAGETRLISEILRLDPLKLIGSGALLMAVEPKGEEAVKKALRKAGIQASKIGFFTKSKRVLVKGDGKEEIVETPPVDELWRFLEGSGGAETGEN